MIQTTLTNVVTALKTTVHELHTRIAVCECNKRSTAKIATFKDVIKIMQSEVQQGNSIFISGEVTKLEPKTSIKKDIFEDTSNVAKKN